MACSVAAAAIFSGIFMVAHRDGDQVADNNSESDKSNSFGAGSEPVEMASVKMTCRDVVQQLDAYKVTVQMNADQRTVMQNELMEDVNFHLQSCKKCSKMVEQFLA